MQQFINLFKAKGWFRRAPKLTLGGPWNSKNSDFVRDILQKSHFQAIRTWDPVKSPPATFRTRLEAPLRLQRGLQGEVHEPWVVLKTL